MLLEPMIVRFVKAKIIVIYYYSLFFTRTNGCLLNSFVVLSIPSVHKFRLVLTLRWTQLWKKKVKHKKIGSEKN